MQPRPASDRKEGGEEYLDHPSPGPENPPYEVVRCRVGSCRACCGPPRRPRPSSATSPARKPSGARRSSLREDLHERHVAARAAALVGAGVVGRPRSPADAGSTPAPPSSVRSTAPPPRLARTPRSARRPRRSGASASRASATRSSARRRSPRRCRAASTRSPPTSSTATIRRSATSIAADRAEGAGRARSRQEGDRSSTPRRSPRSRKKRARAGVPAGWVR